MRPCIKILVGVLAVACVLTASIILGRKHHLQHILVWVDSHRYQGFFIFSAIYILFTVMFIPPAALALGAGAVFGLWVGILLVWWSAILGESVAFILGRFLLRGFVKAQTRHLPSWQAMEAALREDGWKLVLLLRCSPVMPFTLVNYALGVSSLPFWQYLWPSVVGILPGIFLYVYLGTLAKNITEVMQSKGLKQASRGTQIAFFTVSGVTAILAIVLVTIYAKRAISRRLVSHQDQEGDRQESEGTEDMERGVPEVLESVHLLHHHQQHRRTSSGSCQPNQE